jgi:tRNA A37 threonylcarbamoyladenosine synthetase subunit TsaC/SUA5/YrdC
VARDRRALRSSIRIVRVEERYEVYPTDSVPTYLRDRTEAIVTLLDFQKRSRNHHHSSLLDESDIV